MVREGPRGRRDRKDEHVPPPHHAADQHVVVDTPSPASLCQPVGEFAERGELAIRSRRSRRGLASTTIGWRGVNSMMAKASAAGACRALSAVCPRATPAVATAATARVRNIRSQRLHLRGSATRCPVDLMTGTRLYHQIRKAGRRGFRPTTCGRASSSARRSGSRSEARPDCGAGGADGEPAGRVRMGVRSRSPLTRWWPINAALESCSVSALIASGPWLDPANVHRERPAALGRPALP
jgi:hypothetical protein